MGPSGLISECVTLARPGRRGGDGARAGRAFPSGLFSEVAISATGGKMSWGELRIAGGLEEGRTRPVGRDRLLLPWEALETIPLK